MRIDQGNELKCEDGCDDGGDAEAESRELLTNVSAISQDHPPLTYHQKTKFKETLVRLPRDE